LELAEEEAGGGEALPERRDILRAKMSPGFARSPARLGGVIAHQGQLAAEWGKRE
jgi:hypothetical protein